MTSNVTVLEGDLPLSPQQIEKLIQLVLSRLEQKKLADERSRSATQLRRQSAPAMWNGE
jgi:hypothetical protein